MDHLPPEISSKIYRLACTDGGTTGRSLALVSRFIRDASEPYQLHSIAINNAADAAGFIKRLGCTSARGICVRNLYFSNGMISTASIYEDERQAAAAPAKKDPSNRRTLKGLFYTSVPDDLTPNYLRLRAAQRLTAEKTCSRIRKIREVTQRQDNDLMHSLLVILRMLSSSLQTPTLDLIRLDGIQMLHPSVLNTFQFPALRSLVVRGSLNMYTPFDTTTILKISMGILPRLKHLDLVQCFLPMPAVWLKDIFRDLGHSLTHIRLNYSAATSIKSNYTADLDTGVVQGEFPPALERVLVQLRMCARVGVGVDSEWTFNHGWKIEAWRLEVDPSYKIVVLYVEDEETAMEDLVARWS